MSATSRSETLTTFGDPYGEALPEERRELVRLRVDQLVWATDVCATTWLFVPGDSMPVIGSLWARKYPLPGRHHGR